MFGHTEFFRRTQALLGASALVLGTVILQGASPVRAISPPQTFFFTGGAQTYSVPASVCSITVDAFGAAGGGLFVGGGPGAGLGGQANATFSVAPLELLQVNVGGHGLPPAGLSG